MKKVLFFAAAMFAAVSLNAESVVIYQEGMVPEKSHKDADNNTIIDQEGTVIAEANVLKEVWATNNLKVSVLDGAKQWILKSGVGDDNVATFTAQDGNTYSKHYAQGGTNGNAASLIKDAATSAHIEIVPAVAGKLYVAAKFGKNKPIWAAKVPQQIIDDEELSLANMLEYLVEGFSTGKDNGDGTPAIDVPAYPKEDGTGVQETAASADVYAALPLDVEPGYTYFFWVSGSKLMLCGLSFEASEEPSEEGIFDATEAVKATKVIENGQVVIIRGDVRYNALGTVME